MNLIKIGNRIINLENMNSVIYYPESVTDRDMTGVVTKQSKLEVVFVGDGSYYLRGEEADLIWRQLSSHSFDLRSQPKGDEG